MFIYYIDGMIFTTENYDEIPWYKISSPDENTPAYSDLTTDKKLWCEKGDIWHRLFGPAYIWSDGKEQFWLNDKRHANVNYWLEEHPNQTNAFQVEMLLKYT
jgi:hypothetical protein